MGNLFNRNSANKEQSRGAVAALDFLETLDSQWQNEELHIALIGETGSGKSSFVNAFMRWAVRNTHSLAADRASTGVLETTTKRTRYVHPEIPQLVLWDLPGANGMNIPRKDYLKSDKVQIDSYNFFVILTKESLTEFDLWLAAEIHKLGKGFILVRTHVDRALQNMPHDNPTQWENASQDDMLEYIREGVQKLLEDAAVTGKIHFDTKVFLINNKDHTQFEFAALHEEIMERFPAEKRDALCMVLEPMGKKIVQGKVQTLKDYVWASAAVSAGGAAVPLPGVSLAVDVALVVALFIHFRKHLGLDLESVQRAAVVYGVPENRLKKRVAKYLLARTNSEILLCVARLVPQLVVAQGIEEFAKLIPLISLAVTVPMSFATTYWTANCILTDMAKTAEDMLMECLKRYHPGPFKVALIGEIKSGKSCFANTIRKLDGQNKDHAKMWACSDIRESTKRRTPYHHPEHKRMIIWDLPGINGMNITKEDYFTSKDVGFPDYDFYVIFLASRLTENVTTIAEKLENLGKSFIFVRTKVDEDLVNMRDESPPGRWTPDIPESEMLNYLREGLQPGLAKFNSQLFLVNNRDTSQFDFSLMEAELLARFNEHQNPYVAEVVAEDAEGQVE